jgi:uncharacterized protein YjiS (DUF1127 family)
MFTTAHGTDRSFRRPGSGRGLGILGRLIIRRRMRREVQSMRQLDDYLLDDIGLTREAANKTQLPKWDAPAHWRR